jgi:FkbH-like protein
MHLRTNQFNLTTERYDEAAVKGMLDAGDRFVVLHGRALDKFGDHGLVICGTARIDGDTADVQSFLMSCRVIGRGVETAFLGEMLKHLEGRGVRQVEAAYIPTKKNGQVKDFYKNAGFARLRADGNAEIWGWSRDTAELPASDAIAVRWES